MENQLNTGTLDSIKKGETLLIDVKWLHSQNPTSKGYFFKFFAIFLSLTNVSAQGWSPQIQYSFEFFVTNNALF